MIRQPFALRVRQGRADAFRLLLRVAWPDITEALDRAGADNFSLWQASDLVFGYLELAGEAPRETAKELGKRLKAVFEARFAGLFDWLSDPSGTMRLMYEDTGIVRMNRELLRHRVFMTKLKGPVEDEYRRRHRALEEARGGVPDPGPDSNFTIWSAGGYIFGYDEIDTTMERDMTERDRESTIAWETAMLEIMDWVTDDVDWITGAHHGHVRRLGWHH